MERETELILQAKDPLSEMGKKEDHLALSCRKGREGMDGIKGISLMRLVL